MRFRIGNEWHEPEDGKPIMVFLEPMDRLIITTMDPHSNLYAAFSDLDNANLTTEQKLAWMTTETIKVKPAPPAAPYVPPEQMPAEATSKVVDITTGKKP